MYCIVKNKKPKWTLSLTCVVMGRHLVRVVSFELQSWCSNPRGGNQECCPVAKRDLHSRRYLHGLASQLHSFRRIHWWETQLVHWQDRCWGWPRKQVLWSVFKKGNLRYRTLIRTRWIHGILPFLAGSTDANRFLNSNQGYPSRWPWQRNHAILRRTTKWRR